MVVKKKTVAKGQICIILLNLIVPEQKTYLKHWCRKCIVIMIQIHLSDTIMYTLTEINVTYYVTNMYYSP